MRTRAPHSPARLADLGCVPRRRRRDERSNADLRRDAGRARTLDPRVPWILEYSSIAVIVALVPAVAFYEGRVPDHAQRAGERRSLRTLSAVCFSVSTSPGWFCCATSPMPLFWTRLPLLRRTARRSGLRVSQRPVALRRDRGDAEPVCSVEEHKREAEAGRTEARQTGRLTLKSGNARSCSTPRRWSGRRPPPTMSTFAPTASPTWRASASPRSNSRSSEARSGYVVRVHRSRIVNRAKVVEIAPSRDGDFRIKTIDGSQLGSGSRRYRRLLSP